MPVVQSFVCLSVRFGEAGAGVGLRADVPRCRTARESWRSAAVSVGSWQHRPRPSARRGRPPVRRGQSSRGSVPAECDVTTAPDVVQGRGRMPHGPRRHARERRDHSAAGMHAPQGMPRAPTFDPTSHTRGRAMQCTGAHWACATDTTAGEAKGPPGHGQRAGHKATCAGESFRSGCGVDLGLGTSACGSFWAGGAGGSLSACSFAFFAAFWASASFSCALVDHMCCGFVQLRRKRSLSLACSATLGAA